MIAMVKYCLKTAFRPFKKGGNETFYIVLLITLKLIIYEFFFHCPLSKKGGNLLGQFTFNIVLLITLKLVILHFFSIALAN